MRALIDDILSAFRLLTRLPMPGGGPAAAQMRATSVWAYPLVGAGVGALSALIWFLAQLAGFGLGLSAGLALTAQVLMTGALHEDGLADFADCLGARGGKQAALAVLRDSRIGTYGVIALVLALGLRWGSIAGLALHSVLAGLICSALLGRLAIVALLALLQPARPDGLGARLANPPRASLVAAMALSLLLVALNLPLLIAAASLLAAALAVAITAILARKHIGGYTGDVLGAGEQLAQTAALLVLAAMT